MNFQLEVIAFNIASCAAAERAGAHRIELCDNPGEGGTTPSLGFIKMARQCTSLPLYPIIRPRGGDFLYSEEEFSAMLQDVKVCKDAGCEGVVIGMLNTDGSIDKWRTAQLVELAYPMGVTFHRAFDRVRNAEEALEDVIAAGCERILTSGLKANALDGAATIASMIQLADNRIVIMPGSGVRSTNILELFGLTGATEFHSSARTTVKTNMEFQSLLMNEDLASVDLDMHEVSEILNKLRSL